MATFTTLNRAKDAIVSAGLGADAAATFLRTAELHGANETFVLNSDLNAFINWRTASNNALAASRAARAA